MKKSKINFSKPYVDINKIINMRYNILTIMIIILIFILFLSLFYIQIVNSKEYKEKLELLTGNLIEGTTAPRGRIYDRNHKLLVDNKPVKIITYTKNKNTTKEEIKIAYNLAEHLEIDYSNLTENELRKFWIKNNKDEANKLITKE